MARGFPPRLKGSKCEGGNQEAGVGHLSLYIIYAVHLSEFGTLIPISELSGSWQTISEDEIGGCKCRFSVNLQGNLNTCGSQVSQVSALRLLDEDEDRKKQKE